MMNWKLWAFLGGAFIALVLGGLVLWPMVVSALK